jgi:serine/threonine protein kinase/WD40 repeat protein
MGDSESTRSVQQDGPSPPLNEPETNLDWAAVENIFSTASELPPESRMEFLKLRCADSVALLREVESLLESESQAGQFMIDSADKAFLNSECPLQLPRRIGRYNLVQIIGEGGFGTVYLADQDRPIHRRVALKVIRQGMDSRSAIARFEVEQQALALMEHPGIAKVFDAGETDNAQPYFVMELVEGISITRYCDQHKLDIKSRLELFIAVCNALQHAHQRGIIHRDIKPSNILVSLQEGNAVPKLIDFGIAQAANEPGSGPSVPKPMSPSIGTPVYMSPEQADGREIDIRSDIYSLGILLYELLTGTTPFGAHDSQRISRDQMLRLIREIDPPLPSAMLASLGETLPAAAANRSTEPRKLTLQVRGDLDCIVIKAMAKDRERRYESAGELARDLGRYLKSEPVDAFPPRTLYHLKKLVSRNRNRVSFAAVIFVLALAAGLAYIQSIRAEQRKTKAALILATAKGIEADKRRDDANRSLVLAAIAQARGSQTGAASGRRFDSLAVLRDAAKIDPSVAVRSQAISCLALADLRIVKEWRGNNDTICNNHECTIYAEGVPAALKPRWMLANVDQELLLRRVPLSDNKDFPVLLRLKCPIWRQRVAFSPDDRLVAASGDDGHIRIYSLFGKLVLDVKNGPCFDFTPDGTGFAAARVHGPVDLYDLHTGKMIRELKWDSQNAISFSPDGRRLAMFGIGESTPGVDVGDLNTEEVGRLPHTERTASLAWNPDGIRLAVGCGDYNIYQWNVTNVTTPFPLPTLTGHHQKVIGVEFSHGGDVLASTGWDDSTRLWDPVSGEQLVCVFGAGRLTFSSDDRSLGMSGYVGTHFLAEVATGREERRTLSAPPRDRTSRVAFTPDGLVMALGGKKVIRFWNLSNLASGIQSLDLPMTEPVNCVVFTPDGSSLIASTDSGLLRIHLIEQPVPAGQKGMPIRQRMIDPLIEPLLSLPTQDGSQIELSPDGRNVAVAQWGQEPRLVNLQNPSQIVKLAGGSRSTCYTSWSSDGKWVATGPWWPEAGEYATVWDAKTGRRVANLPIAFDSTVTFSPDNRWLVTGTAEEYRFWQVGSWKSDHAIPRKADGEAFAIFSPDSQTVAIASSQQGCKLVRADTGTEIATIDDHGEGLPVGFSPDGTELITSCQNTPAGPALQLWQLRKIRQELKEMNLDWPTPALLTPGPSTPINLSLMMPTNRKGK